MSIHSTGQAFQQNGARHNAAENDRGKYFC